MAFAVWASVSPQAHAQNGEQQSGAVSWHVIDRFRLFAAADEGGDAPPPHLGDADELMAPVYAAHSDAGGSGDWVATQWTAFAETARHAAFAAGAASYPENASPDEVRRAHDTARQSPRYFRWDRRTDTYDRSYLRPRRYWIEANLVGAADGEVCDWRVQSSGELISMRLPCSRAQLPVPASWSASSTSSGRHRAALEVIAPTGARSSAEVEIHDRLIVALGDSVASGEGNPDIAADWRAFDDEALLAELAAAGGESGAGWFMTRTAAEHVAGAVWFDEQCHRSLNSWTARTAMALAAEDPHGAVTFVSFACGGTSTYDGMLFPQDSPPGGERFTFMGNDRVRSRPAHDAHRAELEVVRGQSPRLGQLDAVARLLCDRTEPFTETVYREVERESSWRSDEYEGAACPNPVREITQVLITLGGNDAGFAEAIIWSVVPRRGQNPVEGLLYRVANNGLEGRKCPRRTAEDPGCASAPPISQYTDPDGGCTTEGDLPAPVPRGRPTGEYLVTCFLPFALRDVSERIRTMHVPRERQLWSAYPSAFWRGRADENDSERREVLRLAGDDPNHYLVQHPNYSWLCGRDETLPARVIENGEDDSQALLALYGGADGAGRIPVAGWFFRQFSAPDLGFRIMRWESHEAAQYLYAPMVSQIEREFAPHWVGEFLGDDPASPDSEADARGWCAGGGQGGVFPRLRVIPGHQRWAQSYAPSMWQPYARSARLIRSPSDSALTQFPGPGYGESVSLFVMTNRFADAVSGMMHPNAEAHAIMANEAMTRLRPGTSVGASPRAD